MFVEDLPISGPKLFRARRIEDARGYFTEVFNQGAFREAGLPTSFVQDNESFSRNKGTIRGLHFQLPPRGQGKLVRVLKGKIFDVVVDIRKDSKTFGEHVAVELSADNQLQFWIPIGFAHGFCTLEPDCLVTYKVTDFYVPELDAGLAWNDPDLKIKWPVDGQGTTLSEKDKTHPFLRDLNYRLDDIL